MENSLGEFVYFNKKKILVAIIIIGLAIGGIIYYFFSDWQNDEETIEKEKDEVVISEKKENVEEKEQETETKEVTNCFFDIKGEVKKPGVYSISCDKRVVDAIKTSGGITNQGDTSVLNLSKKIEDGMVIVVYSKKEISAFVETLKKEEEKKEICENSNIQNDACITSNNNSNEKKESTVNINTASLEELMTLSGIGESKAKSIIEYRTKTPFKKKEDLLNVTGIGDSLYASIKENITV